MSSRFTFVRRAILGVALLAALVGMPAGAAMLGQPHGKPVLVVEGDIGLTNRPGQAVFDLPMLERLGLVSITTSSPWYTDKVTFEGVPMARLMEAVGAAGDEVVAIALNDYKTDIPISDFEQYGAILALKRDGLYMPVRDKGPLFIVYPYDARTELHSQKFYGRSVWQLARLVVR
ncbi:MAG TPA: oxidoreductase [Afifellaceae bacterium]|nr:oxidoreductase [Afifellaceae bacterium]